MVSCNLRKRQWQPSQHSCLENPMDGGAWWAAVHGVTKSRTRLSKFTFKGLAKESEKAMAPYSRTLAWKIPWMEEPGRLQSMGSWRVGHDWASSLSLFIFLHWRRKWQPTPVSLSGESPSGKPRGLPSMGSHRVGHDWSNLARCFCTVLTREQSVSGDYGGCGRCKGLKN